MRPSPLRPRPASARASDYFGAATGEAVSWCRWGDRCDEHGCPGSDLYIYDASDDGIYCCACRLHDGDDFVTKTADEMRNHIEEHLLAGHHVSLSLRKSAADDRSVTR